MFNSNNVQEQTKDATIHEMKQKKKGFQSAFLEQSIFVLFCNLAPKPIK
jgi:predicted secreted acid phosphatase